MQQIMVGCWLRQVTNITTQEMDKFPGGLWLAIISFKMFAYFCPIFLLFTT